MKLAKVNGVELCYELSGSGDPIVFIQGVARQLIEWPGQLLSTLQQKGYQTLTYDHRDSGLSTHLEFPHQGALKEELEKINRGKISHLPYQLSDLVADLLALCDAVHIHQFHCVGYSMGGMVAQLLAISCPERLKSLTLINTHSGHRYHSIPPDTKTELSLFSVPRASESSLLNYLVRLRSRLAGDHCSTSKSDWRDVCVSLLARGYSAQGQLNQMYAIAAARDRSDKLAELTLPTMVVQGENDPLIPLSAAEQLKMLMPHANLQVIPFMGHELEQAYVGALSNLMFMQIN